LESPLYDIELENVRFAYNGSGPVLDGISLAVRPREFLAVLGPNGGGKSTLLRVMLGILEPQAGKVSLLGRPPLESVRQVGYVPQDANTNRGFPVSVEDVVLMGRVRGGAGILEPFRKGPGRRGRSHGADGNRASSPQPDR